MQQEPSNRDCEYQCPDLEPHTMEHISSQVDLLASLVEWPTHDKIVENTMNKTLSDDRYFDSVIYLSANDSLNSDDESKNKQDFSSPEIAKDTLKSSIDNDEIW